MSAKLSPLAILFLAILFADSAMAQAAESGWMLRVRSTYLELDNSNSTTAVVPALGTVEVEDKLIPEVDVSYFFTRNWAAELVLTVPQEHDVTFAGTGIGSVKQLPPTLLVQYHFRPDGRMQPYAGIGVNYTWIDPDLNAAPAVGIDAPLNVDRSSWGLAGQAGADIRITSRWFANLDIKYIQMAADNIRVSGGALAGTKVTDLDLDPWLLSGGVGYRFGGNR